MMEAMIAKRYVKALSSLMNEADLENTQVLFEALSSAFEDASFSTIINDPQISSEAKIQLMLSMVESAQSETINNLVRLLAERGRLFIIPAMTEELRLLLANTRRAYEGKVYSKSEIEPAMLFALGGDLGNKMGASISLAYVASDYDGIKVEVEDLGVEVSLSKSRINTQLVEHILKAI